MEMQISFLLLFLSNQVSSDNQISEAVREISLIDVDPVDYHRQDDINVDNVTVPREWLLNECYCDVSVRIAKAIFDGSDSFPPD